MSEELKKLIKQDRRDLFRLENHRFFDHARFSKVACISMSQQKIVETLIRKITEISKKDFDLFKLSVPRMYIDEEKSIFSMPNIMSDDYEEVVSEIQENENISVAFRILEDFKTYFDYIFFYSGDLQDLVISELQKMQDAKLLRKISTHQNQMLLKGFSFPILETCLKTVFEEEAEIFRFQPSFEKMAEETPLDKNFTQEDIKYLARKSIFKFNPYDIESYIEAEDFLGQRVYAQIESAYIWKNRSNAIIMRLNLAGYFGDLYRAGGFSICSFPIKMDENGIEKATINKETVKAFSENLVEGEIKNFSKKKLEDLVVKCMRKILNIMIYMGADNYYAEQVDFKQKLIEDSAHLNRKKARLFRKPKHGDRDYIIIGRPRPKGQYVGSGDDPSYTVTPHYRKAHWRRQRYGPGRELIKNIFIEGIYVHQDKTDVPIKKKTYIVKGSKEEYDGVKRARERGEI